MATKTIDNLIDAIEIAFQNTKIQKKKQCLSAYNFSFASIHGKHYVMRRRELVQNNPS